MLKQAHIGLRILNMAMKVRRPEYSAVTELDLKLYVHAFAKNKSY